MTSLRKHYAVWSVMFCNSPDDSGCCWSYATEQQAREAARYLEAQGVWSVKVVVTP